MRGRQDPDGGLRTLQAAIAEIEAGRRTTPLIGEPASNGEVEVTFLAKREGGQAPRIVSDVTGWGEHIDGTFDFTAGTMARVGATDWYCPSGRCRAQRAHRVSNRLRHDRLPVRSAQSAPQRGTLTSAERRRPSS